MPPLTRSQTKPLPSSSTNGDTSQTTETLSSRHLLRHRRNAARPHNNAKNTTTTASTDTTDMDSPVNHPQSPPRFTIDLSLPPTERYADVCHALGDEMRGLQSIFDEVVGGFLPSWLYVPSAVLNRIAWAFLWRVYDTEEHAELDVSFPPSSSIRLPEPGIFDINDVLCYAVCSRVTTKSWIELLTRGKTERTSH
jgi:hypothetical protein